MFLTARDMLNPAIMVIARAIQKRFAHSEPVNKLTRVYVQSTFASWLNEVEKQTQQTPRRHELSELGRDQRKSGSTKTRPAVSQLIPLHALSASRTKTFSSGGLAQVTRLRPRPLPTQSQNAVAIKRAQQTSQNVVSFDTHRIKKNKI